LKYHINNQLGVEIVPNLHYCRFPVNSRPTRECF
jgi:hypothetical protein